MLDGDNDGKCTFAYFRDFYRVNILNIYMVSILNSNNCHTCDIKDRAFFLNCISFSIQYLKYLWMWSKMNVLYFCERNKSKIIILIFTLSVLLIIHDSKLAHNSELFQQTHDGYKVSTSNTPMTVLLLSYSR